MLPPYQNISSTMLIFSCIDRILQMYVDDSSTVFSVNSDYHSKIPQMKHYTGDTWIYFSLIKPSAYVIDCTSRDLDETLQLLEYKTFFKPSAVFFLITGFVDTEISKVLRKYFVYKFIMIDFSLGDSIKLYTSDMVQKNSSELFEIGSCTNQTISLTKKLPDRKAGEVFQWNNRVIKIGVGDSPPSAIQDPLGGPFTGTDIDIVDFISEQMQFKPQYEASENFIGVKRNGRYNGALGTLATKSVDMVMGGMLATGDSCLDFTVSQPIHRTTYSWFVPGPTSVPFLKRVALIFKPSVSIALFLFQVLMTLLSVTMNRLVFVEKTMFADEVFKLCTSAFGAPVRISLSEKFSKKIFYICWFAFWLIINACFTSKLLECLIKKKYHYPIDSLEALNDSYLDVCILRGLEFGLNEYGTRVITCTECEECSNRTAFQRDLVTVRNSDLVNFYKSKYYLSRNGDPLLHPLKENYFATFNVMIFRKNQPIFERFNMILKRMITSGIVAYMRQRYSASWKKNNITLVSEWGSLRLEPLQFLFQFWIIGLILSGIVFIDEILKHRNIIVR